MAAHHFRWGHVAAAALALSAASSVLGPDNAESRTDYDTQPQPSYAPPAWLFVPAWIGLKALAVRADTALLNAPADPPAAGQRRGVLAARGVDWLFWTTTQTITVRLGSPRLGVAWALVQLASTAAVVALTRRRVPTVAANLCPQLAWLCYAVVIGVGQARLRRPAEMGASS